MRRIWKVLLVAGSLAATAILNGCPAAHDDYPGGSCKTDNDCFKGEKCMNASICVPVTPEVDMAMMPQGGDMAPPSGDMALQGGDMAQGEDMVPVDLLPAGDL